MEAQIVASATHSPAAPLDEYIECLWYHEIRGYSGREGFLTARFVPGVEAYSLVRSAVAALDES